MCVFELLSHKLAVGAQALQRGTGGRPELSPSDLAAMMAGLPSGAIALGYAKLAGDATAEKDLYAALHVQAAYLARRGQWEIPRGSQWLYLLALMVRDDLILPRPMLGRTAAAAWMSVYVPMSERQWRAVWKDRHAALHDVGLGWECALRHQLGRQVYGGEV